MSEFLQRVESSVDRQRLFSRGQRILVAVSGGVDSLVLLHALHALAKKNRWKLSVAHFNHRLRGRASDADEELVRQTARDLRLKLFADRADVKAFAAQAKISVEMAARKFRHEFLARAARAQKVATVALAHHADDQVELFFLRLLRGTGGEGLAGMKWRSLSAADQTIALVRPLLDFSKAELLAFAREKKIRFRDDATNFSADLLRNRIRNELLPLLRKKYQPAVDRTVLRLMDVAGTEAEFVGAIAARILHRKIKTKNLFAELPLAIQRRLIRHQLIALRIPPEFALVERLREKPDQAVSVTTGVAVKRDAAGQISCQPPPTAEFKAAELKSKLVGSRGQLQFSGQDFSWALKPLTGKRSHPPDPTECFDADKVGGEIILRHWRAGDRFQPSGLKSAVKLQDLFVNAKIPAARRRSLVLATTRTGEIFWVPGLRIGERFKLTPATRRQLVWQWRTTGPVSQPPRRQGRQDGLK